VLTVFDVAKYILNRQGPLSAMKLQKLVYYAQAWALVWDGRFLFRNRIEAWANGPVVKALYDHHRGAFTVSSRDLASVGDARKITGETKKTIDAVLGHYGDMSPHVLSELTHQEDPWKDARGGLAPGVRSRREITRASIERYYGSL